VSPYLLRTRCTRRTRNRQSHPVWLETAPGATSPPHPARTAPCSHRALLPPHLVGRLASGAVADDRRGSATKAGISGLCARGMAPQI